MSLCFLRVLSGLHRPIVTHTHAPRQAVSPALPAGGARRKAAAYAEAAGHCRAAQASPLHLDDARNPVPRLERRMWWIHCCETYALAGGESAGLAAPCFRDAVEQAGLWDTVGQRPTRYYRGLQASPGQHCH